jgi:phosphate starvation-inducible membrane PsiE
VHIIEEYLGGGALSAPPLTRLKGVNHSSRQFLIINGIAFLLMILGIGLSRKFKFPEWLLVCLGTVVLINGLSHTVSSLTMAEYNPGLITGVLLFIPLGAITVIGLKTRMRVRRYCVAIAVGIAIHGVISLLALRGGSLFGA